jgi:hypothetical protein
MSNSFKAIRLLLACVLILGLLPQGFGGAGIAEASIIPPSGNSDGGASGNVTMAVYQIDDTSHTVTAVVYSNPQGDLVSPTLSGHLEVYIQSSTSITPQDISVESRFAYTSEQLGPNLVVLRNFEDTYGAGFAFRTFVSVRQGETTKQLFLARLNSGESLFKFSASEQGLPQTIHSFLLKNMDNNMPTFIPDYVLSDSGNLYMILPYGSYNLQLNAGPQSNASYVRAYRVTRFVDSSTEGKLTEIPLNAEGRDWTAVKMSIRAYDGSLLVGNDQVVTLKRSFYPSDGSDPYLFDSEYEVKTQSSEMSYSPDYGVPITYYMDNSSAASYDLIAQIDRLLPDSSSYESILAYSSQVLTTPGGLFDWKISLGDLLKISVNPVGTGTVPIPISMNACLNYKAEAPYTLFTCYPGFGIDGSSSTYGNGYQMSLPIGYPANASGISKVYVPKNFTVSNFFYMMSANDGGSNYGNMTFMKYGEQFANRMKSAASNPSGVTIDLGGKISDIRTEYIADSRTVTAYLANESGDRLINVYNSNSVDYNTYPVSVRFELVENEGSSETKFQLYGLYPQHVLSSDVRLENVKIRFHGFERNGAALNYDILTKPATQASPWETKFPMIVSLSSTSALNVPQGQFIHAVSDTNERRSFGIDALGEAAITSLPAGHWWFRTVQTDGSLGMDLFEYFNTTSSFVQIGQASADWPNSNNGLVIALPVAVLNRTNGLSQPLDVADIAMFAKKIGTATTWDINQDGQALDKSDIQFLLQSLKHRFFTSTTASTATTFTQ